MNGACPKCGGTERERLGANYWKCTSLVSDRGTVSQHDHGQELASGALGMRSEAWVTERICDHAYTDGVATTNVACECGLFAVGLCTSCGKAVCGTHRDTSGLCPSCLLQVRAATPETPEELERKTAEAAEQQRLEHARQASNLRGDPTEIDEAVMVLLPRVLTVLLAAGHPNSETRTHVVEGRLRRRSETVEGYRFWQKYNKPLPSDATPWNYRELRPRGLQEVLLLLDSTFLGIDADGSWVRELNVTSEQRLSGTQSLYNQSQRFGLKVDVPFCLQELWRDWEDGYFRSR